MIKACEVCHSKQSRPFLTLPDYQMDFPSGKFEYRQCIDCGLVFISEISSDYKAAEYPSDYSPHQSKGSISRKRVEAVEKYRQSGTILDIGCGSGEFLAHFACNPHWFPYGIEPAPRAAELTRNKSPRINVIEGTLQPGIFPLSFFDVITLWDVLEHTSSPSTALEISFSLLKPDGLLILRVPNLDSFDYQVFGKYWAGLDAPRHKYVFNRDNLARLISSKGFEIVECKSHIGYYLNFVKSTEFWLRGTRGNSIITKFLLLILKNPVSRLLSAPFFYFAGLGTRGSQLVVTMVKPS